MHIELGNPAARDWTAPAVGVESVQRGVYDTPVVTYMSIPSEYSLEEGHDMNQFAGHVGRAIGGDGVTKLPGLEALLAVAHFGDGAWTKHSASSPTWVWSDNEVMAQYLSDLYGCPKGRPADVEATHYTRAGAPGVYPELTRADFGDMQGLLVNSGRDNFSQAMFSFLSQVGAFGTATATTATTLTSGAITSVASNQYAGYVIYAPVAGVYGIIASNTSGTTPVFTIDQWYSVAAPSTTAGTTPGATAVYIIGLGGPATMFGGVSTTNTASVATDTTMAGELATAGGAVVRKICPIAHSAGTTTTTLTPVWTMNATDATAGPFTIYRVGFFPGANVTNAAKMSFETLLSASATLTASGDQLTVTETVTGS